MDNKQLKHDELLRTRPFLAGVLREFIANGESKDAIMSRVKAVLVTSDERLSLIDAYVEIEIGVSHVDSN